MAEKKTTKKKTGTKPKTSKASVPKAVAADVETPIQEHSEKKSAWKPDLNARVPVRSAVYGKLTYIDPRTKLKYTWNEFGQTEYLELQELRTARNSYPDFFINRWWEIDDTNALKWLDAEKFYNGSLSVDDFDSLFTKTPEEIKAVVAMMPAAQKVNFGLRAKELIERGDIDSMRVVRALEESLNLKLDL